MTLPSRRAFLGSLGSLAGALSVRGWAADKAGPPVAPVERVTDTYFGTSVTDPYRWMENVEDPRWMPFLRGQAAYARKTLDAIKGRKELATRVAALSGGAERIDTIQLAGPWVFTSRRPAGAATFRLFVRRGFDGADRLLVNADTRRKGDTHFALSYWFASPDGKFVLYGVAASGSEQTVIEIMEVASGRILPERIDRAQYANPSWLPDGSGFFFNRLAEGVKQHTTDFYKNSVCWLHKVGTDPARDVKVLARGQFPDVPMNEIDFPAVAAQPGSNIAVAVLQSGVQREQVVFVQSLAAAAAGNAGWKRICTVEDQVTGVTFRGDDIYLISEKGAPLGRVVHVKADAPAIGGAREMMREGVAALRGVFAARDGIYVQGIEAAYARIFRIANDAQETQPVALPYEGSISAPFADPSIDGLVVVLQSWVQPEQVWLVPPAGKVTATHIVKPPAFDAKAYESTMLFAKAGDGTRIPVSLVYRRGLKRGGTAPALVQAYGAYAISLEPLFAPRFIAWLERGGIWATAHVRGGGEYGRAWHEAGRLLTKPNTWRDLIASCEMLIQEGWTRASKLSINGGSAGGITVGMALVERPDLFAAVISDVGSSNPLRAEFGQNGPPNIPEFGSVQTEEGFKGLYAMDAYQHVKDGTAYPAVMLTTGVNDPRVDPWNAGKMAARLQAATSSHKPVLLRVDFQAGHGFGSTRQQYDAQVTDMFAFALSQSH